MYYYYYYYLQQQPTTNIVNVIISRSVLLDEGFVMNDMIKSLLNTVGRGQHPSGREEGPSADGLPGAVQQESHVGQRMSLHLLPSDDISLATSTCG